MKKIIALVVVVAALFGWKTCTAGSTEPVDGMQLAVVVRVVDGDTVRLRAVSDGALPADEVPVRLLEVDAPESVHPSVPDECFGGEAADQLRTLLPIGARVTVELDREHRDRYGRWLVYLWRDSRMVNEQLVAAGAAEAVLFEPNDAHIDQLEWAEDLARREQRGMWSACR